MDDDQQRRAEQRRRSDEINARRKSRNLVLGLILGGLAVLFFALTIVRFPSP